MKSSCEAFLAVVLSVVIHVPVRAFLQAQKLRGASACSVVPAELSEGVRCVDCTDCPYTVPARRHYRSVVFHLVFVRLIVSICVGTDRTARCVPGSQATAPVGGLPGAIMCLVIKRACLTAYAVQVYLFMPAECLLDRRVVFVKLLPADYLTLTVRLSGCQFKRRPFYCHYVMSFSHV